MSLRKIISRIFRHSKPAVEVNRRGITPLHEFNEPDEMGWTVTTRKGGTYVKIGRNYLATIDGIKYHLVSGSLYYPSSTPYGYGTSPIINFYEINGHTLPAGLVYFDNLEEEIL